VETRQIEREGDGSGAGAVAGDQGSGGGDAMIHNTLPMRIKLAVASAAA
jgi:hypothetical protein